MMKRLFVLLLLAPLAAACDDGQPVVVRASLPDGGAIAGMPVRLLPYDRAAVLDSLAAAAETPRPALPQELVQRLHDTAAAEPAAPAPAPADGAAADTAAVDTAAVDPASLTREQARARLDTLRALRRAWAAEAFRDYDQAVRDRAQQAGRGELADTTDASGTARFAAEPGQWWVWARYALPDEELEWIVPVTVGEGGTGAEVRLSAENARREPIF